MQRATVPLVQLKDYISVKNTHFDVWAMGMFDNNRHNRVGHNSDEEWLSLNLGATNRRTNYETPMNCNSTRDYICFCRRTFVHLAAFKNHENTCKKSKKRLSNALIRAKELFALKEKKDNSESPGHGVDIQCGETSLLGTNPEHGQSVDLEV